MPSGYTSGLAATILFDNCVLYRGGTKFGVSVGGISFTPEGEIRHVEFDGVRSEIEGLHRYTMQGGVIEGEFLFTFEGMLPYLNPGMTSAAGADNVDTILTPKDSSELFSGTDYLDNLRLVAQRGAEFCEVLFEKAYCSTWTWTGPDKNEQKARATFRAVLPAADAATSTDTPPVKYQVLNAIS